MGNKIYIGESRIVKAGRGVFAGKTIKKGKIIEVCPLLFFTEEEYGFLANTLLKDYVYEYNKTGCMLALGYGSLYNHHPDPNAIYEIGPPEDGLSAQDVLYFSATRSIKKDEEIFINYGKYFDKVFGY